MFLGAEITVGCGVLFVAFHIDLFGLMVRHISFNQWHAPANYSQILTLWVKQELMVYAWMCERELSSYKCLYENT